MLRLTAGHLLVFAFALLAAMNASQASGLRAGEVWCDPLTGFAIGGYDPVAYFVRHAPGLGAHGVELNVDGIAWKFANKANREVFARDPEVYAPRYAGRDPMQLARGYEALGNPHHWLIENGALYLFASALSRSQWLEASPDERAQASKNWPAVISRTQ